MVLKIRTYSNQVKMKKVDCDLATSLLKPSEVSPEEQKVLCQHCGRTVSNDIRCIGKCVEDTEY